MTIFPERTELVRGRDPWVWRDAGHGFDGKFKVEVVRADIADRHKRERARLLAALRNARAFASAVGSHTDDVCIAVLNECDQAIEMCEAEE